MKMIKIEKEINIAVKIFQLKVENSILPVLSMKVQKTVTLRSFICG